jgi:diguanylate cyclase (GGDEF)-like protein
LYQFSGKWAILTAVNDNVTARRAPRILIADDLPDLLDALRETLEREGYEVTAVSDGETALAAIKAEPPDIAVLDLRMPKMDGFEVCRALREDPLLENLPVVILSATGSRESKVEGLDLGADDFITKPVDVRELLARIRMILKRSRQGLDANPLTRLPGNLSIESRVEKGIASGQPLAVLYVDLNQFKAYNDVYGYDAGDRVIKSLAKILVDEIPKGASFVGHIGGDDFIVLSDPERMEKTAAHACSRFDKIVPSFYSVEDRERGAIQAVDRQGKIREFPLLSVAIGICHNKDRKLKSFAQIAHLGAELKKAAKTKPGSAYVIDRRRD